MSTDADAAWSSIVDAAAARYRAVDGHAWRFARAKLRGDRVFRHVLERGLAPAGAQVLDLGCGQGLLASLLLAAGRAGEAGQWPAGWAPAPRGVRCTGIDLGARDIARARAALVDEAAFVHGDMRSVGYPACDVVVFFDTLHYLGPEEQDAVLCRARDALRGGGTMLLRVHEAAAPLRFRLGLAVDRWTMRLRGGGFAPLHGRTQAGWTASLERLGLEVASCRMDGRAPFANRLLVARCP